MNCKIHEECGVFGIFCRETSQVAKTAYYALFALQHRGQESAGIVVNHDGVFSAYKDKGLVNDVFTSEILEKLGAEVVYPERDMAIRLAHRLETSKSLDFIQLSERVNISKLIIPDRLVGKTVLETNLRKHFGINIIAIENNSTVMQTVDPNYQFKKGDILFVSGEKKGLNNLLVWSKREDA